MKESLINLVGRDVERIEVTSSYIQIYSGLGGHEREATVYREGYVLDEVDIDILHFVGSKVLDIVRDERENISDTEDCKKIIYRLGYERDNDGGRYIAKITLIETPEESDLTSLM